MMRDAVWKVCAQDHRLGGWLPRSRESEAQDVLGELRGQDIFPTCDPAKRQMRTSIFTHHESLITNQLFERATRRKKNPTESPANRRVLSRRTRCYFFR